jgi:hypothetical protein
MIEREIKKYLHGSSNIRDVVGNRIYQGRAIQNVQGALLILRNITSERHYSLSEEVATKASILQIDAYDETAVKAYDLGELVRNRLSGYTGAAGDITIYGSTIISERSNVEEPGNRGDRWVFVYSFDFELTHSQTSPTFA